MKDCKSVILSVSKWDFLKGHRVLAALRKVIDAGVHVYLTVSLCLLAPFFISAVYAGDGLVNAATVSRITGIAAVAVGGTPSDVIFESSFEFQPVLPGKIWLDAAIPADGERVSAQFATRVSVDIKYSGVITPGVVRLKLDGQDVSPQVLVRPNGLSYDIPQPLSLGLHNVEVQVGDASANWSFTVVGAPELLSITPRDEEFSYNNPPPIDVHVRDATEDLDPDTLQLTLNNRNLLPATLVTWISPREVTLRFSPSEPVPSGYQQVRVQVANTAGGLLEGYSDFFIEVEPEYSVTFLDPLDAAVILDSNLAVRVFAEATTSSLDSLSLNGQEIGVVAEQDEGSIYGTQLVLEPGENTLVVVATFEDGVTRTATVHVTYDAPPIVQINAPNDWQAFGPLVNRGSNPTPGGAINLMGSVERPVEVTGSVSRRVESVMVNQQQAQLSADGKNFSFERFFLHEGSNLVSVSATDNLGRVATATVTVYVDQTAPILSLESPLDGSVTTSARIDVRGIVNDAVEAGLSATEPALTVVNEANSVAVIANVADRYFLAMDVPLEVGSNTLTVTATDQMGNIRTKSVKVTRVAVGSERITLFSGNRQTAAMNSVLESPLVVVAMDKDGLPLVDLPVRFDITRGAGSISSLQDQEQRPDGINPARNLVINTDVSGRAQVWLRTGTEVTLAGNMVRAWNERIAEDVVFTATGMRGPAKWVLINGASGTQFAQVNSQPLEAMTILVTDAEFNVLPNTPVQFNIIKGDAVFIQRSAAAGVISEQGQQMTVMTDKNGLASVRPLLGNRAGEIRVSAQAVLDPTTLVGRVVFQVISLQRGSGATQFSGVVLDHIGTPLPGVRLSISRTSLSTVSDEAGKFEFGDQVPAGKIDLHVDGTALRITRNGQILQYPGLHFETAIVQGQLNQLPHAIYLPPINMAHAKTVGGDEDVSLTIPGMEGFEMIVKANSVTFPDGSRVGPVVVSLVNNDRLPMVPPGPSGSFGALAWTIQPTGTRFDPPIEVRIPNTTGMRSGETLPIVQWDHDLATFVAMGSGTVSEDATQIISDPGTGVTKAGWGGGPPPIPPNDADNPPSCPANRGEDCEDKCSISAVEGSCIAEYGISETYTGTSEDSKPFDWSVSQGGNPAQGSGLSFDTAFQELEGKYTYQSNVNAVCPDSPQKKADKKVHAGNPCSKYEPLEMSYVRDDNIADDVLPGDWGTVRTGYSGPYIRGCVTSGKRWSHRAEKVEYKYSIHLADMASRIVLESADSTAITDANCSRVLRELTPSKSKYGTRIAEYDTYLPLPIIEGHENFHTVDGKEKIVDKTFVEFKRIMEGRSDTDCGVDNPHKEIQKMHDKEFKKFKKEYSSSGAHERRAYDEYENPMLANWRAAIRARAVVEEWREQCR